ncbi:MAG: aminoglycoside phosphotransferase family protein [Ilumatobacter sp.]
MDLELPELVQQRARSRGPSGRAWLEALPGVLASLSDRWSLTLGAVLAGGTAGCVVEATDESGAARVVKIAMALDVDDRIAFERSVIVHELAAGRGCAQVIDHDDTSTAVLMERLGPNLADLGYTVPQILEIVTTTLQSFWRVAPDDDRLPTGADKATWLARFITSTWSELRRPCPRIVIDRAVAYCERRAASYTPIDAVLVHGDGHGWNTLAAPDGGFKFVDPEGIRSEPAHDLAVLMREYNEPLVAGDTARLVRDRAERLASVCAVDPEPVWEWGYVERVSTGLANLRDFTDGSGEMFLEVAERCL